MCGGFAAEGPLTNSVDGIRFHAPVGQDFCIFKAIKENKILQIVC